jgi:hypothetical protein
MKVVNKIPGHLIHITSLLSKITDRPNKLECLLFASFWSFTLFNALAYWAHIETVKKINLLIRLILKWKWNVVNKISASPIHITSLLSKITDRPNKVECLLFASLCSFTLFNPLAYWAHIETAKKINLLIRLILKWKWNVVYKISASPIHNTSLLS